MDATGGRGRRRSRGEDGGGQERRTEEIETKGRRRSRVEGLEGCWIGGVAGGRCVLRKGVRWRLGGGAKRWIDVLLALGVGRWALGVRCWAFEIGWRPRSIDGAQPWESVARGGHQVLGGFILLGLGGCRDRCHRVPGGFNLLVLGGIACFRRGCYRCPHSIWGTAQCSDRTDQTQRHCTE